MDRTDVERQREIGKQLLLVDILHCEDDFAIKHEFMRISRRMVAEWVSMTEDEFGGFINRYSALGPYNLGDEAAKTCLKEEIFENEKNAYMFILSTYYKRGARFIEDLKKEDIKSYCEQTAEYNYQIYEGFPVGSSLATAEVLETMIIYYIRYFVGIVTDAISEGYDWDVVARMTRRNISEERFHELEDIISIG